MNLARALHVTSTAGEHRKKMSCLPVTCTKVIHMLHTLIGKIVKFLTNFFVLFASVPGLVLLFASSLLKAIYLSVDVRLLCAVGNASDSRTRGPGFDTRSGHILSFPLSLIQEGQLSVPGESMCTKSKLTAWEV